MLASLLLTGILTAMPSWASAKPQGGPPVNFGVVLYRAFEPLDAIGPLDILQIVAHNTHMNLYIFAETLDPVTTETALEAMNPYNSSFWPTFNPTNTFADEIDLDVLLIPGGPGVRAPNLAPAEAFIARTYPKLQYLITVCTGAGLAARAGVLDGKRATTNKRAWETVTAWGPKTSWIAPARYVVDGNVWTSSGVTAGLDLVFAFIKEVYGKEMWDLMLALTEYMPNAPDFDPYAMRFNVTSKFPESTEED